MERIDFRAFGFLDTISNKNTHRYVLLQGIRHFKAASRNREALRNALALACVRINKPIARRHENFRNLIARDIDKQRIAMESSNRSTTVDRHRESVYRNAKTVKRVNEIVAEKHDFRIAIIIDIAKSDAGEFIPETALAGRTAPIDVCPCNRLFTTFAKFDTCNRSAAAKHNRFNRTIAVQVRTGNTEHFAFRSLHLRRARLMIAKARLHFRLILKRKLAHEDFAFFAYNNTIEIFLVHLAKSQILRMQALRRCKRARHIIGQIHRPESRIRCKEEMRIRNNRACLNGLDCRSARNRLLQIHHIRYRNAGIERGSYKLVLMQRVYAFSIACNSDERTISSPHAIQRDFPFCAVSRKSLLRHHRICREERIAKSVHRLERSIFGSKHNCLARLVVFVIDKHGTAHRICKPDIFRELRFLDAAVIDANRHANYGSRKIQDAIAHESIRRLFDTSLLRNLHRNLDTCITALRCRRIGITIRGDRRHRIRRLLRFRIAYMRKQVRTATEIVSIFANRVLEGLANAQDPVGFHKRKPILMITKVIAKPEVCGPSRQ